MLGAGGAAVMLKPAHHPRACLPLGQVRAMNPDDLMIELKFVFERFNLWEHGYSKSNMDKVRCDLTMILHALLCMSGFPGCARYQAFEASPKKSDEGQP